MNPFALKVLAALGYPTEGLRSKGWDEFAVSGAPQMDFIFTVCDDAAGESLPDLAGPSHDRALGHRGSFQRRRNGHREGGGLRHAARFMKNRIIALSSICRMPSIDRDGARKPPHGIGRMDGASARPRTELPEHVDLRTLPDPLGRAVHRRRHRAWAS